MELQLRKLRKQKEMTQEDLGKAIGQTPRVLGSWEREETALPLEDAARIADVLDCTLDELAGRDFQPANPSELDADETELVGLYRDANPQGRATIIGVARIQPGVEGASASGEVKPA